MSRYRHERAVGDTLSPFQIQLKRGGIPADLTGFTVKFTMVDLAGNLVVAETNATVTDALNGWVQYDFQPLDVAIAGDYIGFFIVYGGAEPDTYPAEDEGIDIELFAKNADRRASTTPGLTATEFMELATSPRRTRTVEGTVEERSVDDLIKADRYAKQGLVTDPPWGISSVRTKPPGTCG